MLNTIALLKPSSASESTVSTEVKRPQASVLNAEVVDHSRALANGMMMTIALLMTAQTMLRTAL